MKEEKKYLVKDVNLIALTEWCNETFQTKKSGEEFSVSDVQGYVRRGYLPAYLGGQIIETCSTKVRGVKSYSVVENN